MAEDRLLYGVYDWRQALKLRHADTPMYALLMAAYLKGDSHNQDKLEAAWPLLCEEVKRRYWAPGGILPEDGKVREE